VQHNFEFDDTSVSILLQTKLQNSFSKHLERHTRKKPLTHPKLINKSHHPRAPTSPANHREKEVSIVTLEYKIPSIFRISQANNT
jgi:hypothetical protein